MSSFSITAIVRLVAARPWPLARFLFAGCAGGVGDAVNEGSDVDGGRGTGGGGATFGGGSTAAVRWAGTMMGVGRGGGSH